MQPVGLDPVRDLLAAGHFAHEEPGRKALRRHLRRRPVREMHQRIGIDVDSGFFLRFARGGAARGPEQVVGRTGIVVGIDPSPEEHPRATVERELGRPPREEDFEAVDTVAPQDDRRRRRGNHELGHQPTDSMVRSPFSWLARNTFLSNVPTLVFGTSSMKLHRSGICHLATCSPRNAASAAASTPEPCLRTTHANGRSCHRGSGTPMTLASTTSGCAIKWFSSSTELIHSPPDLITSLARSVICTNPSELTEPTSPVRSQPSSNFSGDGSP